jgi:integrase
MDVMGWSNVALTTRYQHITTELTASIANQNGDLLWTDQGKTDDEDDGEAPVLAAV